MHMIELDAHSSIHSATIQISIIPKIYNCDSIADSMHTEKIGTNIDSFERIISNVSKFRIQQFQMREAKRK